MLREETRSTQDDARAVYRDQPTLVVAHRQAAGRGRGGSGWENAPRAMAASLAFDPGWPPDRQPLIALLAGVAAARVLEPLDLKWPNDLLRGDLKVGGILVEGSEPLVVGCGINLWWPDPPPGVGSIHGDDPGEAKAEEVARAWSESVLGLAEAGPDRWPRDEYRQRCVTLGRRITWEPSGSGRAVDVGPDGALIVETDDRLVEIRSGEVRHVR